MEIHEQKEGGTVTLAIEGRMDAATARALEGRFDRVKEDADTLILDFARLKYISSAGLEVVIIMLKWCQARDKHLVITNLPDSIRVVFETAGMLKFFIRDERFAVVQKELTDQRAAYALSGMLGEKSLPEISALLARLDRLHVSEAVFDCAKVPAAAPAARQLLKDTQEKWQAAGRTLTVENSVDPRA